MFNYNYNVFKFKFHSSTADIPLFFYMLECSFIQAVVFAQLYFYMGMNLVIFY